MDAESTVEAYYEALRAGEPLYPFFAREGTTVKFGVGERLTGYDEVREGLGEQTETTEDWIVESDRLVVTERDDHGWFSDDVFMAWTDRERDERREYETRWSGTLERREDDADLETAWRFVGMHVSCAVSGSSEDSSGGPRTSEASEEAPRRSREAGGDRGEAGRDGGV
jgi:hypothetical protein